MTGAIIHGYGTNVFVDAHTWPHDANLVMNILVELLKMRDYLPDVLFLQRIRISMFLLFLLFGWGKGSSVRYGIAIQLVWLNLQHSTLSIWHNNTISGLPKRGQSVYSVHATIQLVPRCVEMGVPLVAAVVFEF